ncbi:hypothetical protein [Novosphingobium sp.]|uniref:hypothetical protein n=1 Tax=Novosphingobium sp. TaxID=1874826 RepID=UPI0025F18049|nr:hypothetical protein [Novosphingobium sp.]
MQIDRALAAWWRTRRALRMDRAQMAAARARAWHKLQPALAQTPALADFAGKALTAFPITDQSDLRADYGQWNSLGLSDLHLRCMADAAEHGAATGDLAAGWSTGTGGGTRGMFVAGSAERADYIGQSLARLLAPADLLKRQRIALHLRAASSLYSDVRGGRFGFAHLPLAPPIEQTCSELELFDPTVLIAPPHRLLAMMERGLRLRSLRRLFFGSEPLSWAETDALTAHFGLRPRAIYQATEGFLGFGCMQGRLHLNDDALVIELEPVERTAGFRAVITDLHRRSQPVVRVRGDDIIEPTGEQCPCGYAGRVIAPLAGRVQDVWHLSGRKVLPSQVVAAVEGVLGGTTHWQAAASAKAITLRTAPGCAGHDAVTALASLTGRAVPVRAMDDLPPWPGPKRRKVVWCHD